MTRLATRYARANRKLDLEDLKQEARIGVFIAIQSFVPGPMSLKSWIWLKANGRLFDHVRTARGRDTNVYATAEAKRTRRFTELDEELYSAPDARSLEERVLEREELAEVVGRVLRQMSQKEGSGLIALFREETAREYAERVGINEKAASWRLYRARLRAREIYEAL